MKVEMTHMMGTDLTVVNAARVSYGKHTETMRDQDVRLIAYLAKHGHWSPFAHPQASFRISANIAVARQLFRHQVGLTVNETSRRYVTDAPEFDLPDVWRSAPGKGQSKQGSGEPLDDATQAFINGVAYDGVLAYALSWYEMLLDHGVAPEQARLVLPMALVTEWMWTGSLYAFARVCRERLGPNAQAETRAVAEGIAAAMATAFPVSWPAIMEVGNDD